MQITLNEIPINNLYVPLHLTSLVVDATGVLIIVGEAQDFLVTTMEICTIVIWDLF